MPIQFRCSQCNQLLSIAARKAGMRISCPVCQGDLTVPTGETIAPRRPGSSETVVVNRPAASKDEVWRMGEEPGSNGKAAPLDKKATWWAAETPPAPQPPTGEAMSAQIAESQPTPSESITALQPGSGESDEPPKPSLALRASELAPEPIPTTRSRLRLSRRQAIFAGSGVAASVLVASLIAYLALPRNAENNSVAETVPSPVASITPAPVVEILPQPPAEEDQAIELPELVAAPTPVEEKPMPALLPEAPAVKQPVARKPLVIKRRDLRSEEDLRKQMEKVPELALDTGTRQTVAFALVTHAKVAHMQRRQADTTPLFIKQQRPDLAGLPMRMGDACKIGPSTAEHLEGGSLKLRSYLFDSVKAAAGGGAISRGRRRRPSARPAHLQQAAYRRRRQA